MCLPKKAIMKYKELVGVSQKELLDKEKGIKEELFKLNSQRYGGRVEKPHMFQLLKKDIARVKTALNQLNKKQGQ